jgi:hypothetical protein
MDFMMRLAVLRVSGNEIDPDVFAARFGFSPDMVWHAGVPDSMGPVTVGSGFNLTIADEDSAAALVRRVREWIQANRTVLQAVAEARAAAVIDVGLSVGESDAFTASVTWAHSDLTILAECGVNLRVSAYPASEADGPESRDCPEQ